MRTTGAIPNCRIAWGEAGECSPTSREVIGARVRPWHAVVCGHHCTRHEAHFQSSSITPSLGGLRGLILSVVVFVKSRPLSARESVRHLGNARTTLAGSIARCCGLRRVSAARRGATRSNRGLSGRAWAALGPRTKFQLAVGLPRSPESACWCGPRVCQRLAKGPEQSVAGHGDCSKPR